ACGPAARPSRYQLGVKVSGRVSGAGWADRENEYIIHGSTPTGSADGGPCALNCHNGNEMYGFHTAGATVVFADGSVHLLRTGLDIRIAARLITRPASEVVGDY